MTHDPRPLGSTGHRVPPIGLGCCQLGGDWGEVTEVDALATLHAAVDAGIRLLDTADVYGDGRSERMLTRLRRDLGADADELFVATKVGRRADPHEPAQFTPQAIRDWVQLHCPPPAVLDDDTVFGALDDLRTSHRADRRGGCLLAR